MKVTFKGKSLFEDDGQPSDTLASLKFPTDSHVEAFLRLEADEEVYNFNSEQELMEALVQEIKGRAVKLPKKRPDDVREPKLVEAAIRKVDRVLKLRRETEMMLLQAEVEERFFSIEEKILWEGVMLPLLPVRLLAGCGSSNNSSSDYTTVNGTNTVTIFIAHGKYADEATKVSDFANTTAGKALYDYVKRHYNNPNAGSVGVYCCGANQVVSEVSARLKNEGIPTDLIITNPSAMSYGGVTTVAAPANFQKVEDHLPGLGVPEDYEPRRMIDIINSLRDVAKQKATELLQSRKLGKVSIQYIDISDSKKGLIRKQSSWHKYNGQVP